MRIIKIRRAKGRIAEMRVGKSDSPKAPRSKEKERSKSVHTTNGAKATRERKTTRKIKHQAKKHRISEMRPSICEKRSLKGRVMRVSVLERSSGADPWPWEADK